MKFGVNVKEVTFAYFLIVIVASLGLCSTDILWYFFLTHHQHRESTMYSYDPVNEVDLFIYLMFLDIVLLNFFMESRNYNINYIRVTHT